MSELVIPTLYEDNDVLVIDKPVGVQVHADGRIENETIADWFVRREPSARGVGEPQTLQDGTVIDRPGIVHRLDRDTSGIMILAKTQDAFLHLKAEFHDRRAKKEYRAFVYGTMKENEGTISRKIGRSASDPRKRSAEKGAKGTLRDAVTDWELITQNETHAYLKLLPKTGRTHQLRVHLKSISRPIVGDTLYAPQNLLAGDNLGFDRLALHAYQLTLILPNGSMQTFTADLPDSFIEAEKKVSI